MKVSGLYCDNMVLQRDTVNTVTGMADKNEKITADFDGKEYEGIADEKGYFQIEIPVGMDKEIHILKVSDSKGDIKVISNIVLGDVFLLGGQSNMELPVSMTLDPYRDTIEAEADNDYIRMYQVPKNFDFSGEPTLLEEGAWVSVNSKSIYEFSSVAYFFSKIKYEKDGVPVGLVHTAVGGAPIESYMSEANILETAEKIRATHKLNSQCDGNKNMGCIYCYEKMFAADKDEELIKNTIEEDTRRQEEYQKDIIERDPGLKNNWMNKWTDHISETFTIPGFLNGTRYEKYLGTLWLQKTINVPKEFLQKESLLFLGTLVDSDVTYINGIKVGETTFKYPPRRYPVPAGILKEGENVITIKLGMDNNLGGAQPDMPYYIKCGQKTIDLTGEWFIREGVSAGRLEGPTFYIWHPAALFNSMIASLKGFAFKAVLFYQGESNCGYPEYYLELFDAMVKEWRSLFGQELPFIYAELASYLGDGPVYTSDPFDGVREKQWEALKVIDNAYIVENKDLGQYNELHPQKKHLLAERFYETYLKIFNN